MEKPSAKKKVGRPRKYPDDNARVRASRARRTALEVRWEVYLPHASRARLEKFAKREGIRTAFALQVLIHDCLTLDGKRKNWQYLDSLADGRKK